MINAQVVVAIGVVVALLGLLTANKIDCSGGIGTFANKSIIVLAIFSHDNGVRSINQSAARAIGASSLME